MSWVAVGVGVVGAVGAYASSRSASSSAQANSEREIEAQKELTRLKRQYQLEDRKYNQDAVGAWAKYLDPALVGPNVGKGTEGSTPTVSSDSATKDDKAIDDPNDPRFKPNALAPAQNALPINHPAAFQGMRPQGGKIPQSLWFARQYPDYDPNNPTG